MYILGKKMVLAIIADRVKEVSTGWKSSTELMFLLI